jgi:poly-gamma-glutamate synthesis protein (capsule biosynthesis protein)
MLLLATGAAAAFWHFAIGSQQPQGELASSASHTRFDAAPGAGAPGADGAAIDGATADGAALPSQDASVWPVVRRVSFAAVGDNLIHSSVYNYGRLNDGTYDFNKLYAPVAPHIQQADFAFINQETVCGGTGLGLADYPCFNSPHEILDAVGNAGFDWLNTASNHSMDVGEAGILSQLEHLRTLPSLTQTGTNASQEERDTPRVAEVNGLRIGLASYTYGLNGFVLPAGKGYLVNLIDEDAIAADYERLAAVSDVQVVNMHWGQEYSHFPTDEQRWLAQYLADLGYDVVIGEHPHVIEPADMLTGASGNQTLVLYSLGNFMSAQDEPERMLGLMAKWTLSYDTRTAAVGFEDIELWPTVTHFHNSWTGFAAYALRDYTDELAAVHQIRSAGLTRQGLVDLARRVLGDKFPVML